MRRFTAETVAGGAEGFENNVQSFECYVLKQICI